MQFVKNGPEVPEALLEAHEEGRVVFFCGAGISYPAGLPDFAGLVRNVYQELNIDKSGPEDEALKGCKFDTALGLLEQRFPNGRSVVRNAIAKSLTPNFGGPKAKQTHEALLTLSKNRNGNTRLITTNFDRVFEEVIKSKRLGTNSFAAPLLPVPKNKWDGLIYLHGVLDGSQSNENLNSLIVTSGDFGLAYLIERWAARFVSELFRNYTVCFVGYSINDPILRYMMDALAADTLLGETTPDAYAFGDYSKKRESKVVNEWKAKNVTPILYRKHCKHYYLHETLHAWANNYRDGVNGKQAIVAKYAQTKPTGSTKQDDYVRRMVWALSDETGLPARLFAKADPLPSIEWLDVLKDERFGHQDLSRFGVSRNEKGFAIEGDEIKFSILRRPSPSSRSPYMSAVGRLGAEFPKWDNVMKELSPWIARHINQPEVLFWVVGQGGNLHPNFNGELNRALEDDTNISAPMKRLWKFVLSGKTKSNLYNISLHSWIDSFKKYGGSTALRFELKKALRPILRIGRPYSFKTSHTENSVEKVSDIANVKISLKSEFVHSAFNETKEIEGFKAFLPQILMDMSELLFETLDLMAEAEILSDFHDYSYIQLPSISGHDQNKDYNDWTLLVNLCRDSWKETAETDPDAAVAILTLWAHSKYPIFRRLVFFAIAQKPELVGTKLALDWLLSDECRWLWSTSTMRETIRLLVSMGSILRGDEGTRLQRAIIAGPPRSTFHADTSEEDYNRFFDRMRWIRLKKLISAGAVAIPESDETLRKLEVANPTWQLADDERDEFPIWSSNGKDTVVREVPKNPEELVQWLRDNPSSDDIRSPDNWPQRCREDFHISADALLKLAKDNEWYAQRWGQALQAWANEELAAKSWKCTVKTVALMPNDPFNEALDAITWWVNENSKNILYFEDEFFDLIDRIIAVSLNDTDEIVEISINYAINHAVGRATSSLLNWWFERDIEDNQGLPDQIKPQLSNICSSNVNSSRLGMIMLAQQIILLFRVDPDWTKENLLPSFHWKENPDFAAAMWDSFLHSPRIYWPLLSELKGPFLETPNHIDALSDTCIDQYSRFLTYTALDTASPFQRSEFKNTISRLSKRSLGVVAETLFNAAQGAGDEKAKYIENRLIPFFRSCWPNSDNVIPEAVSRYLAQICAISDTAFEATFENFQNFLIPITDFSYLVRLLGKTDLPVTHPATVLRLLDKIIPGQVQYLADDFGRLISKVSAADPTLAENSGFIRLSILSQQHIADLGE